MLYAKAFNLWQLSVEGDNYMKTITQKQLQKILHYDKETGIFTWAYRRAHRALKGSVAGTIYNNEYIVITIDKKLYKAHRLAWLHVYGEFPKVHIDHINHIRTDNSIDNLRSVTLQENNKNKSLGRNNTSGICGVRWKKQSNKWIARINAFGKKIHLGYFISFDEAVKARKKAEVIYGYHENHGMEVKT